MHTVARPSRLLRRHLIGLAVCAAVLALAWPGAARAAAGPSFSIAAAPGQASAAHGYFVLSLAPGQRSTQRVVVSNTSSAPIVVELAPIDANTTPVGGVSYLLPGQPLTRTGAWVSLSESRVPLAPGEVRQVDVTTTVPSGAQPGDYVAGISALIPNKKAASASPSASNKTSVQVNVQTRRVIAVQVSVPGAAVRKLTITGVKAVPAAGGMDLAIGIASPGGKFTSGSGTITVPSTRLKRDFPLDLFVPGTSIAYPITHWQIAPKAGAYPASVVIHYASNTQVATWSGSITVGGAALKQLKNQYVPPAGTVAAKTPWLMYGLIGALIIIVLIMGFALLRRRRPEAKS